jgi:hypothetical protein
VPTVLVRARPTLQVPEVDIRPLSSAIAGGLIEMYLAGISFRRVEDITEALWGTRVSPSTELRSTPRSRNRRIEGRESVSLSRRDRHEAKLGGRVRNCWWPRPSIQKGFARSWDLQLVRPGFPVRFSSPTFRARSRFICLGRQPSTRMRLTPACCPPRPGAK